MQTHTHIQTFIDMAEILNWKFSLSTAQSQRALETTQISLLPGCFSSLDVLNIPLRVSNIGGVSERDIKSYSGCREFGQTTQSSMNGTLFDN